MSSVVVMLFFSARMVDKAVLNNTFSAYVLTFVLRLFVYTLCMGQLLIYHIGCSVEAYRFRDTTQIRCFRTLSYVFNVQEDISVVQTLLSIWMLRACPNLCPP